MYKEIKVLNKLKENLQNIDTGNLKNKIAYPLYYEENGHLIKELENGEKWIIKLDKDYKEILIARLK